MEAPTNIGNGMERLFSKSETAGLLHVSERQVQSMASKGILGNCRVGRRLMFRESDLRNYLDGTYTTPRGDVR